MPGQWLSFNMDSVFPHSTEGSKTTDLFLPNGHDKRCRCSLTVMSNGYRTLSQHLNDLKKENFSLKLRIYFLEERIQQKFEESSEDVYRTVSSTALTEYEEMNGNLTGDEWGCDWLHFREQENNTMISTSWYYSISTLMVWCESWSVPLSIEIILIMEVVQRHWSTSTGCWPSCCADLSDVTCHVCVWPSACF